MSLDLELDDLVVVDKQIRVLSDRVGLGLVSFSTTSPVSASTNWRSTLLPVLLLVVLNEIRHEVLQAG